MEIPKHLAEAQNNYLKEKENAMKSDCDIILNAFEKMVMKQLPNNMNKLDDDKSFIKGDYIKLKNKNINIIECYNEKKISELENIVMEISSKIHNGFHSNLRIVNTINPYYTHYVAIKRPFYYFL